MGSWVHREKEFSHSIFLIHMLWNFACVCVSHIEWYIEKWSKGSRLPFADQVEHQIWYSISISNFQSDKRLLWANIQIYCQRYPYVDNLMIWSSFPLRMYTLIWFFFSRFTFHNWNFLFSFAIHSIHCCKTNSAG